MNFISQPIKRETTAPLHDDIVFVTKKLPGTINVIGVNLRLMDRKFFELI